MTSLLSTEFSDMFAKVKKAARHIANIEPRLINQVLEELSKALIKDTADILMANQRDLDRMENTNPKYDRLLLTAARIENMADDLLKVAELPSPLARKLSEKVLANGLRLGKISVPLGVVGFIFEARPNVTIDVFSLCLKSGNGCVLKGASDAFNSNQALLKIISNTLKKFSVDPDCVLLLPTDRGATLELLNARGFVDAIIPRGGRELIDFVKTNARVPVIETGAGVVHLYFDDKGEILKGAQLILNSKTRKVSACNSLDSLLVHRSRIAQLPLLLGMLIPFKVGIHATDEVIKALKGSYPDELLIKMTNSSNSKEYLSYGLTVNLVDNVEEAVDHINTYTAHNSEAIVTEDKDSARYFQMYVDAAVVYVNASTAFTDGAQFGLGAEVGISTQKLHASGPMGLGELTSYKWLVDGEGQIRE